MLTMMGAAPASANDATVLKQLVADFDRELEETSAEKWDLRRSPAYRKLMDYRARTDGHNAFLTMIEPSPGNKGQITGSEFPRGTWALTYDDGPHPSRTQPILDVLKRNHLIVTFFWLAQNAEKHKKVIQAAANEGHSLQNHSYTHADLTKVTDLKLGFEVSVSNQVLAENFPERPRFFRTPYGAKNTKVRRTIANEGLIHVLWNVDSLDWADKNANSVAERVRKQMNKSGGGIILFHDIQSHTAKATEILLSKIGRVRFVTIDEAVEDLNASKAIGMN